MAQVLIESIIDYRCKNGINEHKPVFHEYLLWAWPFAMLHFCKSCLWRPWDRQERRKDKKMGQVYSEDSKYLGQTGFIFTFHGKPRNILEKMSAANALLGSHNCKRNPSIGIFLGCFQRPFHSSDAETSGLIWK